MLGGSVTLALTSESLRLGWRMIATVGLISQISDRVSSSSIRCQLESRICRSCVLKLLLGIVIMGPCFLRFEVFVFTSRSSDWVRPSIFAKFLLIISNGYPLAIRVFFSLSSSVCRVSSWVIINLYLRACE